MKDNLSIVITIIILVLLMVFFPLYNFFERQDDMSYNLVLKATSNFADEVMNNGYIDQRGYNNFVTNLANTGNVYDIEVEAHRKVLTLAGTDIYEEQSYIDYTDDIFETIESNNTSNLMERPLKNNIYFFNPKDEIYIKVKNSNTTMAGALFNAIIPTSSKTRIEINYGGIIKNNAWKEIDATYTGQYLPPSSPIIYIDRNGGVNRKDIVEKCVKDEDGYYEVAYNDIVNYGLYANSILYNDSQFSHILWKITDLTDNSTKTERITNIDSSSDNNVEVKLVTDYTFNKDHKYEIEVNTVDNKGYSSDYTKIKVIIKNTSEKKNQVLGDINGDSKVDKEDISKIVEMLRNNESLPSSIDYNEDGVKNINDYIKLSQDVYGYILGDANDDGNVNISDMTEIQRYIRDNIKSPYTSNGQRNADFNNDGKIDNMDYLNIQYLINW